MATDNEKTQLTPDEAVRAFLANRMHGVDQAVIVMMYGVNPGRVSEAITAIEYASEHIKEIYNMAIEAKKCST